MSRLVTIGEAADALGVSVQTLRRWEAEGRLKPDERTSGGQRRYDLARLRPEMFRGNDPADRKTIAYARVSSHDQKDDLERQRQVLEAYCASQGWTFEIVSDPGSGMNYHKKGLRLLLRAILDDKVGRLVVLHKDRLLRFVKRKTSKSLSSTRVRTPRSRKIWPKTFLRSSPYSRHACTARVPARTRRCSMA